MPAHTVRTMAAPDLAAARGVITRLHEGARAADGHASLGEAVWRDLERPGPDSAGFLLDGVAYVHVARSDNFAPRHWVVARLVAPEARNGATWRPLVDAAVAHVGAHGGGRAVLWVPGSDGSDDAVLTGAGFEPARELYEMRVPLPLRESPSWPRGVSARTFEPGRDEPAWLAVNNRAFANHPEQGDWIEATLARRMSESWFDPTLFLLAFDTAGLAGFNWLKVHDARGRDPRLGEIFVVGVDPRAYGTGLGRALCVAGFELVAARGITTGSLFCAADNAPALRLYDRLGFTVRRTDRAYELDVETR